MFLIINVKKAKSQGIKKEKKIYYYDNIIMAHRQLFKAIL